MAITITEKQEDQYMVNGKLVYLNSENKWIAVEELTVNESKEFCRHILKTRKEK